MLNGLVIAAVIAVALLLWRVASSVSRHLPKVRDAAPGFNLHDQNGKARTLEDFRGRWLVLYFYPRDDTPGCTEQAALFRDAMRDLESLGAVVCGVSVDNSASHAAFARKYSLPFALLADRSGQVATRYGSLLNLGLTRFAKRNTFLVDPQGKIARTYIGVDPSRNAQDVMSDLKALAPRQ